MKFRFNNQVLYKNFIHKQLKNYNSLKLNIINYSYINHIFELNKCLVLKNKIDFLSNNKLIINKQKKKINLMPNEILQKLNKNNFLNNKLKNQNKFIFTLEYQNIINNQFFNSINFLIKSRSQVQLEYIPLFFYFNTLKIKKLLKFFKYNQKFKYITQINLLKYIFINLYFFINFIKKKKNEFA